MKKKNCIITGGTSGLGLSLVEKFINNGFFVHILAKDNKKINNLNNYLHKKNLKSFKFYQTDLAEINELKESISQLKNLNTIDILINNAGAIFLKKALNSKGIEKTFAVNYLSHFFLTLSLLDLIKKTENSRIINISSWGHELAKLNLNDINFSEKYNGVVAYNNSKLMNILFNYKINRIYTNTINTYAIHPGWINTNFGNYNKFAPRYIIKIARFLLAKNPNKVANEIYNLCTNDKYLNYSGKYLINNDVKKSSKLSYQIDLQDKLWEISLQLTNLKNIIN
jgi:NAD(P)-dependent dehydrogenase (short-subunit alcohol dehydrogenase family)